MAKIRHNSMTALGPKGDHNRWRCNHCDVEGLFKEVTAVDCVSPRLVTDGELLAAIIGAAQKRSGR